MHAFETRVTRLEALANPSGPLLISWRLDDESLATAAHPGRTVHPTTR